MHAHKVVIALLIVMLGSTACSNKKIFQKPGATTQDFNRDIYMCQRDASTIPYGPSGYVATPRYGGGANVQPDGWAAVGRMVAQNNMIEACLNSLGWYEVN